MEGHRDPALTRPEEVVGVCGLGHHARNARRYAACVFVVGATPYQLLLMHTGMVTTPYQTPFLFRPDQGVSAHLWEESQQTAEEDQ